MKPCESYAGYINEALRNPMQVTQLCFPQLYVACYLGLTCCLCATTITYQCYHSFAIGTGAVSRLLALLLDLHWDFPDHFCFAHGRCILSNLRHIADALFPRWMCCSWALGPETRQDSLCRRVGGPSASYCHGGAYSIWHVHRALGWGGFTCRTIFPLEYIYIYIYIYIQIGFRYSKI